MKLYVHVQGNLYNAFTLGMAVKHVKIVFIGKPVQRLFISYFP